MDIRQPTTGIWMDNGTGEAKRTDPVSMVHAAAAQTHQEPLSIKATLRLLDEEGIPAGYLTGANLTEAMQQVYDDTLADMQGRRLALLDQIEDWRLSEHLIEEIARAVIDPLMEGLVGPDARLIHLCYQAVQQATIVVPRRLWWTSVVGKRLERGNPGRRPRNMGAILAMVNHGTYHYVTNNVPRTGLPLSLNQDDKYAVHGYYDGLYLVVRSGLTALLHSAEVSYPDWVRNGPH